MSVLFISLLESHPNESNDVKQTNAEQTHKDTKNKGQWPSRQVRKRAGGLSQQEERAECWALLAVMPGRGRAPGNLCRRLQWVPEGKGGPGADMWMSSGLSDM